MAPEHQLLELLTRRGLALPALVFLEAARPFARLAGQSLIFLAPCLSLVGLGYAELSPWIDLLEDQDRLEALICELEERHG